MTSAFPGMDPYLEDPAFWGDFHIRFINACSDCLVDILPEPYEARIGERVNLVQMSPEVVKLIYPGVALSQGARATSPRAPSATAILEPVTIPHEFVEEIHEPRVEILHRPDRSLVTVLELLSPTNKVADGFHEYRNKRKAILTQKIHLVELDFLIGGKRLPLLRPLPPGDYYALVSRVEKRPNCDVFAWTVRQPLPPLALPLRAPDADLVLDLQKVFALTYERGRYARSLAYTQPPLAPLRDDDKTWAAQTAANRPT